MLHNELVSKNKILFLNSYLWQIKIRKNKFDFDDFLSQIQQIQKMGNFKDVISMIPGVSKMMKDVEIDDNAFKPIVAMIQSMTPAERSNPDLIVGNRRKRIASGSGKSIQEVNNLMKQFEEMRKMMKKMSGMQGKIPGFMRW